jgi:hypothetical protein
VVDKAAGWSHEKDDRKGWAETSDRNIVLSEKLFEIHGLTELFPEREDP